MKSQINTLTEWHYLVWVCGLLRFAHLSANFPLGTMAHISPFKTAHSYAKHLSHLL
ncbi:hypothetical protein [Spirosoma arcticum]